MKPLATFKHISSKNANYGDAEKYYPLYRYPLFQRKGCGEFDCPVLDKWWDGSFSFPWWCGMDDTVIDTLCSSLISAVEELRG